MIDLHLEVEVLSVDGVLGGVMELNVLCVPLDGLRDLVIRRLVDENLPEIASESVCEVDFPASEGYHRFVSWQK